MFANLSKREKVIIISGIIILLGALYYFYLFLPLQDNIKESKKRYQQKKNNLEVLQKIEKKLPEIKEKYQSLNSQKSSNKISINSSVDLLNIFNNLERNHEVNLKSFRPQNLDNKIEINMTYNSNYTELISFFQSFNELNNQFQFKNLSISQRNDNLRTNIKVVFLKGGQNNDK